MTISPQRWSSGTEHRPDPHSDPAGESGEHFKASAAEHIAQALSDFDLQIQVEALPWEEYAAALAAGTPVEELTGIKGTCFLAKDPPPAGSGGRQWPPSRR